MMHKNTASIFTTVLYKLIRISDYTNLSLFHSIYNCKDLTMLSLSYLKHLAWKLNTEVLSCEHQRTFAAQGSKTTQGIAKGLHFSSFS